MLREPRAPWPASVPVRPCVPPPLDRAAAVVTFIGHATFLIQTAAGNILTDPMYSQRASPLSWIGPHRVRQPAVRFDDLPPISTAYAGFFREIPRRLGPIDLALLPIGAYEPRWFMRSVHMNPADAVQAHLDLDAARSVAMHFGTFQLTSEGIDDPTRALDEACRIRQVERSRFQVLDFGESTRVC